MGEKQKSIKCEISFEGIGVHSGLRSRVTIKPLPKNSGIIVRNLRFPDDVIRIGEIIPAAARYATIIAGKNWQLSTIEHVMSALFALGVDNVLVEVDGVEIPILDGSAQPFITSLLEVGLVTQDARKSYVTPKEVIRFEDSQHGRSIEILPAKRSEEDGAIDKNLYVEYQADFDHPLVGAGKISCLFSDSFFVEEIAAARTFGFLEQLPFMKKHGFAKGASLENTVVIGETGFLNKPRFKDEFVRHKFLDLMGDLALLGKQLIGSINAKRTGHNFNRLIIEHFICSPDRWEVI